MSVQQLLNVLEPMSIHPPPPLSDVAGFRAWVEQVNAQIPCEPVAEIRPLTIGGMPAEVVVPANVDASRLTVYFHGGAFMFGSPQSHRAITTRLAVATGASVLVPHYRLAPEHMEPAAHDDSLAAYRWALASGFKPDAIAFAGDSAGGNLVMSTAINARNAALPLPASLVMMSPWLDIAGVGDSHHQVTDDPFLSKDFMSDIAHAYFGASRVPSTDRVATLASDFSGLPPALFHAGTWEILKDDSVQGAQRMRDAGCKADVEIFEGMCHVWQLFGSRVDEATKSLQSCAEFIRLHWENPS